eukprot:g8489.t1
MEKGSIAATRQKAADLLQKAAETGELQQALKELATDNKETLARVQQRTAELLAQAAANGELERVLGDIQKNEEAETRKRVAKTLVEAADSGLLSTILSEDLTAIRMRVQEQLEKAAADGRLEKALRLEAPRWNLQPSAVDDGNLELAMRSVLDERTFQESDEWRKMLKDSLLHSLEDGSLQKALEESHRGEEENALRRTLTIQMSAWNLPELAWKIAFAIAEQEQARREAKQAAKEGAFPKAAPLAKVGRVGEDMNVEEFSAKMFLEAFSEKGRRMNSLSKMIEEAEVQIKRREQQCCQLQAHISRNHLELAHLQLDLDWHHSALEGAEERHKELQTTQRKLLGTLHGRMYEISDAGAPGSWMLIWLPAKTPATALGVDITG